MDVLICYCLECKSELARFCNSWDAIGTSYHSPIKRPQSVGGLEATGQAYGAAPDSSIENSSLQDVACIECQTTLGLQCYSAPTGHLLKREQLILNLSLMSVISEKTRKKATISIHRSIPLTKSSNKRASSVRRASTAQPIRSHLQSVPPPSRPPVPLFHANQPKAPLVETRVSSPPTKVKQSQSDVDKFRSWAESAIRGQQKDIERVSVTVDRIDRDMQSLKAFMDEVRTELVLNREFRNQTLEDNTKSPDQANGSSNNRSRQKDSIHVLSKRLDAITDGILLVNHNASGVDQVKADLERLTNKLDGLEERIATPNFHVSTKQPQLTLPVALSKRSHEDTYNIRTPSTDLTSPPKPRSKRIRFSNINVDEVPSCQPEVETLDNGSLATQQGAPMMESYDEQLDFQDENEYIEAGLRTALTPALQTSRRMSGLDVSIPAQTEEGSASERRQLRDTTANDSGKRRRSNINYSLVPTGSTKRKSDSTKVTARGNTEMRSLRKKKSNSESDSELDVLSIADNASSNFREASLAARKVTLVERERLVRQTLEREMMDMRR